jgi:hypothetical protein
MSPPPEECPACRAVVQMIGIHSHLHCPAGQTAVAPGCTGERAGEEA